jgi:hypothetical protein
VLSFRPSPTAGQTACVVPNERRSRPFRITPGSALQFARRCRRVGRVHAIEKVAVLNVGKPSRIPLE